MLVISYKLKVLIHHCGNNNFINLNLPWAYAESMKNMGKSLLLLNLKGLSLYKYEAIFSGT